MNKPEDIKKLKHLLWRFGFGPGAKSWSKWTTLPHDAWWTRLKNDATPAPETFDVADNAVKGLLMGVGELGRMSKRDLNTEQKKQVRRESRDNLQSLNLLWLEEMTHSKAQLREKIALFWHGHFASRNINILYQQQLLDIIRKNALGSFRTLLFEVSKSAAMLAFLNNQQNKKAHPNENFAREVMELFTLGRGNYTETDIKEAARAFTGWNFKLDGSYAFRRWDHDTGQKTVLGKSGNLDGDDVLNTLLEKRQAAYFIAGKMYKFIVNEAHIPPDRVRWLGDRFYDSNYNIMKLLDDIATSDWFYDDENIGVKIKSPVELWVGIRRQLPMNLLAPDVQLVLQKALGQVLFYPPNVAGWPGGRTWIDNSSLMLRLRIPELLYANQELDVNTKADDDQMMGEAAKGPFRKFAADIDWQSVMPLFPEKDHDSHLAEQIAEQLWQTPLKTLPFEVLDKNVDRSSREAQVKTTIIQLMATPEYQLC